MKPYTPDELTRITATPAMLGRHIGQEFMGNPYGLHPWLLYMEQKILAMLFRPGNEILIVSVPPQNGKSTYCSMLLPAWYLGHNPNHQVINVSYNEKQASKWGRQTLKLIRRYGEPLFGARVDPDSDAASDWKLDNGFGGMMSAGIGNITGNPGHLIIADDLIAGSVEAHSPTIKRKIMEDWDDSLTTRFQENTKVLLVATRWAEDDPSGELIARSQQPGYEGFPVTVVNIKAIAEPDPDELAMMSDEELAEWQDFLGRRYGEGLKGQHSQRFFEIKRASTNPGRWSALHQGTPTFSAGGMFPKEDWRYYVPSDADDRRADDMVLPEIIKKVRVWDLASTPDAGDWTVGALLGRDRPGNVFILGRERFRKGPGDVNARVRAVAETDGHEVPILIEQERSGAGPTVVEGYQRNLLGWSVEPAKAEGDKESRASPYSILQNQNRVYLPRNASWLDEWRDEHAQMDGKDKRPKHDDQIDTAAYGVKFLISAGETELWDPSALGQREGLSPEDQMEALAIREALGLG